LFGAFTALAVCATGFASPVEFATSVRQGFVSEPLRTIGFAPFDCPEQLDCADLQKELAEQLAERTGARVVETNAVRDLMTRASMTSLEDRESRLIIGEGLGVEAFAFLKISKAEVDHVRSGHERWKVVKRDVSIKRASLELRVVARDGAQLAQVSGEAELVDSVKALPSIASHLFAVMVDRAWP